MKTLNTRGIVGSALAIFGAVAGIALLALPMLIESPNNILYSVFGSMFKIGEVYDFLGDTGILYIASVILMMAYTLVTLSLLALAIVSLVGICQKKYNNSMAFAMRCLSLFACLIASLATVLLFLYSLKVHDTTYGYGTIVAIAPAIIGVAAAFTLPSPNEFHLEFKREERLSKEIIKPKG